MNPLTSLNSSQNETQKQHQSTLFSPYRQLKIAGQTYRLSMIPLNQGNNWRWQLQNLLPERYVPGGFKLRILTETGVVFGEAIADSILKQLIVDITPEPDCGIIWEIEPVPENYCSEIWRFEAIAPLNRPI